jgi:GNAT superfamily N-acetyltransferase
LGHSSVTISIARAADAVGIQDVYYRGWLHTYPNEHIGISREDIDDWYKDRYALEKLNALRARLSGPFTHEVTFVARSSVRIVGVCRVRRDTDRNELRSLYLLREYMGKGIGSRLWSTANDFLDKRNDTFVEVATYNDTAIAFYRRHGFKKMGPPRLDTKFKFKSGAIMPIFEMRRDAAVVA